MAQNLKRCVFYLIIAIRAKKKRESQATQQIKKQLCKVWFFLRERLVTMVPCTSIACGVPLVLRWKLNTMPTPATKDLSVDIDHLFKYCWMGSVASSIVVFPRLLSKNSRVAFFFQNLFRLKFTQYKYTCPRRCLKIDRLTYQ